MAQPLKERDFDLIVMLARGHSTALAAKQMQLSRYTVAERIAALLARFKCANRAELVAFCYAHGVLRAGVWPPAENRDVHNLEQVALVSEIGAVGRARE